MDLSSTNSAADIHRGRFAWRSTDWLIAPVARPEDPCVSIKDPSVVRHGGRWHVFASIRSKINTHQVEYLTFAEWEDAHAADRHILTAHPGFFCAPQVFFFSPQNRWVLLAQLIDESRKPALQPAICTTTDLGDPGSWSAPVPLFENDPPGVEVWLDFWIICDETEAHLFFTSLNGKMWHSSSPIAAFPHGWSAPQVVLEADVYEASHTYKLRGSDRYLTMIEAVADGRRYFKAYSATNLGERWEPLAATLESPLAGVTNVTFDGQPWTTSFSHGEFLRTGVDEQLEIDPDELILLYQGVSDEDREGTPYGEIPWRLGLLR